MIDLSEHRKQVGLMLESIKELHPDKYNMLRQALSKSDSGQITPEYTSQLLRNFSADMTKEQQEAANKMQSNLENLNN